jgi:hypothetical protein
MDTRVDKGPLQKIGLVGKVKGGDDGDAGVCEMCGRLGG